jgi:hypothetical protein
MSYASRQFRNLSNERLVLIASIEDDSIFVHCCGSSQGLFKMKDWLMFLTYH